MIFAFQEPLIVGKVYRHMYLIPGEAGKRKYVPFMVMRESTRDEWYNEAKGNEIVSPEELETALRHHILGGFDFYYEVSLD